MLFSGCSSNRVNRLNRFGNRHRRTPGSLYRSFHVNPHLSLGNNITWLFSRVEKIKQVSSAPESDLSLRRKLLQANHQRGSRAPYRSSKGVGMQQKAVRFKSEARCITTGEVYSRQPRDDAQKQTDTITAEEQIAKKTAASADIVWDPSPCDEPMTGVTAEEDQAAAKHRAEEEELDRRIAIAAEHARLNKIRCPITSKFERRRHPALVERSL
ncbi:hypothetical protein VTK56DRAFT_3668 [Thermocarpiscus australiensis]